MAAHAVSHRVGPVLHPADLLQGNAQLPQQFDLEERLDLGVPVIPVAVLAVPPGGQKALGLIEADVLPGNAHQGLHLVDFQVPHLGFRVHDTPSSRGKVKRNFVNFRKRAKKRQRTVLRRFRHMALWARSSRSTERSGRAAAMVSSTSLAPASFSKVKSW